jgi:hypothetical protein
LFSELCEEGIWMGEERQRIYYGVLARYHSHDARWFALFGFAPMIVGAIGMIGSSVTYFGLSFDIGSFFGLGPFVLTESMLMIPVIFIISMLFFAGGLEWYVLCRHCPCYEYSGKEHGNENRFYCLGNWGSPKLFKHKPGPISRGGQAVFILFSSFYVLSPIFYLVDRWEFVAIQLVMAISFFATLRHWACSQCPNFGCILNTVPDENRNQFLEAIARGEVY